MRDKVLHLSNLDKAPAVSGDAVALYLLNGELIADFRGENLFAGMGGGGTTNFSIAIGTVTTGAPGSDADAALREVDGVTYLDLTIPAGEDGAPGDPGLAATIAVGTVTTGAAGSSASITNVGTPSAATFNFIIPKGDTGDDGVDGDSGIFLQRVLATSAAGVTVTNGWAFDGTVPQVSEGTELITATITPKNAGSTIKVVGYAGGGVNFTCTVGLALFRVGGSSDSIGAIGDTASANFDMEVEGEDTASTTSAITYSMRGGRDANTVVFNNTMYGSGMPRLRLELIEIAPPGMSLTSGLSAYQVAVNNGFVGTEPEWLASLVGPTGAAGAGSETTWLTQINPLMGSISNVTFSTPTFDAGVPPFWGYLLSANAINSEVVWKTSLAGGTYTFRLNHYTDTNRGIYSFYLDGVLIGTINGNAAANKLAVGNITGVVIASSGAHEVKVKMASTTSGSYYGTISGISIIRTA